MIVDKVNHISKDNRKSKLIRVEWIFGPLLGLMIWLSLFPSCTKTSLEEFQGDNTCDACTVCDTSFMLSYANDIVPILMINCYESHDAAGIVTWPITVRLDSYGKLKPYVDNGELLCRINNECGLISMPYGRGMLPDCTIARIKAWIRQGVKNN